MVIVLLARVILPATKSLGLIKILLLLSLYLTVKLVAIPDSQLILTLSSTKIPCVDAVDTVTRFLLTFPVITLSP